MTRPFVAVAVLCAGCQPVTCDATVADGMHTVIDVTWDAPRLGTSWVTYDGGEGSIDTPHVDDTDTSHVVELLGLLPLTDVSYTATTQRSHKTWTCSGTIRTGNLPPGLPPLSVTVDERAKESPERYVLGTMNGDAPALFVIDRAGEWRWARAGEPQVATPDVEHRIGGPNVLFNRQASDRATDIGDIVEVAPDGSEVRTIRTPLAHHVFAQGPHGRLALFAIDVRPWTDPATGETMQLVGDKVQEIREGGEIVTLFDTWDHVEPVPDASWDTAFYPQGKDWTHGNGINWNPERGSYLVSFGNARIVFEIDAETGDVIRQLGGRGGYGFTADSVRFFHEHDPRYLDDNTLIVGMSKGGGPGSGAVEYTIDDDRHNIKEIWQYGLDGPLRTESLGQGIPLDNGDVLVSYGGSGVIREVTPAGEVVWELKAGLGAGFGNVEVFDDFYAPRTR